MILDEGSIKFISEKLKLPYSEDNQDWDLEMANYERLDDFISLYSEELNVAQKRALMSLILASFEDFLNKRGMLSDIWSKIKSILISENEIFKDLLDYWGVNEKNDNDCFRITSLLKSI